MTAAVAAALVVAGAGTGVGELSAAGTGGAKGGPSAAKLKRGAAVKRATRAVSAEAATRAAIVESGVRGCRRVTRLRFHCEAFLIEDRPNGLHSCEWVEAVHRRGPKKVRAARLGAIGCERRNLAPTKPERWFSHSHEAVVRRFEATSEGIDLAATAYALSAHASVAFHTDRISPGRRYTCSVDVHLLRTPSAPQAVWLVWSGPATASEWMGDQATGSGAHHLTVSDVAPPGAAGVLCAVGNGGPSRDGRHNTMLPAEVTEVSVDPGTATLFDEGLASP